MANIANDFKMSVALSMLVFKLRSAFELIKQLKYHTNNSYKTKSIPKRRNKITKSNPNGKAIFAQFIK